MRALTRPLGLFAAPLLALFISSCGGGGAASFAEGGIGGSGIGPVTGFGSVFVNGVRYATDANTEISVPAGTFDGTDDRTVLDVGMVVRVDGKVNSDGITGTADRIVYDSSLRGPAANPDTAATRFELLGQVVHVSATTRFTGSDGVRVVTGLGALLDGDRVEVSGFRGAGGDFFATRVAVDGSWPEGGEVEVEDAIASVSGNTLVLASGLEVDLSGAAPEFQPTAGQFVEVKGTFDGTRLLATELSLEDGLIEGDDGDHAEIEGVITAVNGTSLVVNGFNVQITASTDTGGIVAFAIGQRVEVEGELQGGVLVAEEIELKAESEFELKGEVLSVDPDARTVQLFGQDIAVDANTIIDDKAAFFSNVQVGDFLSVHAASGSGGLVATEIAFEDAGEQMVEGPVSEVNGSLLTIGGITVDAFQVPGVLIGLDVGDEVELTGDWNPLSTTFVATGVDDD